MILHKKPLTEAGETWPPPVAPPADFVSAVPVEAKKRELRIGRIALLWALTGLGVPMLVVGILMSLPTNITSGVGNAPLSIAGLGACLLGVAFEATAVVTGVIARRTRTGRWGLALPLLSLLVTVILVLVQHHLNGTWPWQGLSDDCGCDGSG